jgi:hypothetical protein
MNELKVIIHFQMLLVVHAVSSKAKEVMFLHNFLTAKKVELRAFGIEIETDKSLNIFEKYREAEASIAKLDPTRRFYLERLKQDYKIEEERR